MEVTTIMPKTHTRQLKAALYAAGLLILFGLLIDSLPTLICGVIAGFLAFLALEDIRLSHRNHNDGEGSDQS
jgi:urea transporter